VSLDKGFGNRQTQTGRIIIRALARLVGPIEAIKYKLDWFNLEWHVIGSGGESSSASYHVNGTLGQNVASPPTAGSTSFRVSSGYWFGNTGPTGIAGIAIYLPIVLKN
jgi:hypothetical protein